jgi:GDP-L-fucose synthase
MNLDKFTYQEHTHPMLSHINVGSGYDITIHELAEAIAQTVGYAGDISFDTTKPDGTPLKLMDSSRMNALGWKAQVKLDAGLRVAYQDFLNNYVSQN